MKLSRLTLALALTLLAAVESPLQAAYTIRNGSIVEVSNVPTLSLEEHFAAGACAIRDDEWEEAAYQFKIVVENFPTTVYAHEAWFYLGVSFFYLDEYDFANKAFTEYLQCQTNPRFFQDVIEYKFAIADRLARGAKRRFLGTKKLPKWACGKNLALEIYDEVIAAVPCHVIAAEALIAKGYLLWTMCDYSDAVEAFQLVIRRFPKHELAPDCYVLISKVYVDQSTHEYQNPDILAFAGINLARFEKDYPREERLQDVAQDLNDIKEIYANGLYQTGQFYERTCHPAAAVIYYHNVIHQFPDTYIAELSRGRLVCLDATYLDPYTGDIFLEEDQDDSPEEELEETRPRSEGTVERRQQLSGS